MGVVVYGCDCIWVWLYTCVIVFARLINMMATGCLFASEAREDVCVCVCDTVFVYMYVCIRASYCVMVAYTFVQVCRLQGYIHR
jgi:hypothetical protein